MVGANVPTRPPPHGAIIVSRREVRVGRSPRNLQITVVQLSNCHQSYPSVERRRSRRSSRRLRHPFGTSAVDAPSSCCAPPPQRTEISSPTRLPRGHVPGQPHRDAARRDCRSDKQRADEAASLWGCPAHHGSSTHFGWAAIVVVCVVGREYSNESVRSSIGICWAAHARGEQLAAASQKND